MNKSFELPILVLPNLVLPIGSVLGVVRGAPVEERFPRAGTPKAGLREAAKAGCRAGAQLAITMSWFGFVSSSRSSASRWVRLQLVVEGGTLV